MYSRQCIIANVCFVVDRQQRAFGWKSLAFSSLKYADMMYQGLNSITEAHPPPKAKY